MNKTCNNCDHKQACANWTMVWDGPGVTNCHDWSGWHDAITDPPRDERQILIYGTNYHYTIGKYMKNYRCYVRSDAWTVNDILKGVIAWRELTKY